MTTTAPLRSRGKRRARAPLVALAVASALLVASAVMAFVGVFGPAPWGVSTAASPDPGASTGLGPNTSGMPGGRSLGQLFGDGPAMMAGQIWLGGDGRQVTTIADARARAAEAGAARGLHPGEVVQFTDNFYVELKDSRGAATTEVLVDPASGAVRTEPGPAMMWNTGSHAVALTEARARAAASAWLAANRPGETVSTIDSYPGYYTVDTQASGKMMGMLSVNGATGAVWYHTWHGTFVAMEDS
ncbi:peptidase M4 [Intrasporangium chromatireducens Q5-1]|uniref:Peptidase M4 n=1 Tax=Intrasporangium chromatireducens Q5-1 TaxID=584657 RepID=W9GH49_9MICO|nr:hypothetical protein [Intrasporangium chromatireducens]EWT04148.1 peptidase M4 [Intrasporangium chromatireducens Q5-1]